MIFSFGENYVANEFYGKVEKIFNIKLDNKIFKYIYKVIFFEAIKKRPKMLIPFKHNSKILKINFISEWQQHDTKNILSTHESVIKLSDSERLWNGFVTEIQCK